MMTAPSSGSIQRLFSRTTGARQRVARTRERGSVPRLSAAFCALAVLALAGCTSLARHAAPGTSGGVVRPAGLPPEVRRLGLDGSRLAAETAETLDRLRRSEDGTVDILALSGGGAGGAFGAGALVGWTTRGDRPQFDIVTGVSAGAIIAPFAFLGPSWDARLTDAITGPLATRVLERRSLDILFRPSFYRGKPLAEFILNAASDELIAAVARQSAGGRMLLVATTDLDRQTTVIWDLGAIARQNSAGSRALFRKVLLASSSIPGVFPPVLIGAEDDAGQFDVMHADGGVTAAFFVAPEVALIVPGALGELAGTHLYVLMNTQMAGVPTTTAGRIGPIIARASATALIQMSRSQLQLASAFAAERGMTFQVAEIPVDYPYAGSIDFRFAKMRSLFEYGARCAEGGRLWTTLPDALIRELDGLARLAPNRQPNSRGRAEDMPCPAEIGGARHADQ